MDLVLPIQVDMQKESSVMRWPFGVWTTGLLTAVASGAGFWLLLEVGIRLGEVTDGR